MTDDLNSIDVLVGQNVRRMRLAKAMDVAALAALLDTTEAAIEEKEAGRQRFSAEDLRRLFVWAGVAPAAIYAQRDTPT